MVRGGASPYLESWVLELRGDVDRDAVRRAFATLVARHDALRSRFVLAGEEPAQLVEPAAGDPEIPSPACSPGTVDRALRDFVSRPMDLSAGAWRAALFEPEAETVLLAVQVHHVVVDDWALHTLEREFVELYRAAVEGRRPGLGPVLLQPGPFARRQRAAARDDAAWAYWQQALGSLPDTVATAVPGDAAPDAGRAPLGRRVAFPEEHGSGRRLRALCRTLRATPYRWQVVLLLTVTAADACIAAASPLILKFIIDHGILPGHLRVVVWLSLALAGLAVVNAGVVYLQSRCSGRVGEGVVYELRTQVFAHVQQQPVAFFTRTQTGKLISRLNTDVAGARQAVTTLLTQAVSTVLTLVLVLGAMFYLSWQITVAALVMIPLFLIPARLLTRRMQRMTRSLMEQDAEMSSMMTERFNVSGALLAKLYGRPQDEEELFAGKAAQVRDLAIKLVVWGRLLPIVVTVLTTFTTALVYGLGGALTIDGTIEFGTLVAMVALLMRLYGPVNELSTMQATATVALVSFDRVFEVLDLKPLITERPDAKELLPAAGAAAAAPDIEFAGVTFRYPGADEVSMASLEAIPSRKRERSDAPAQDVLHELSFRAPAGKLTALVGPSGAGKTTITQLVPRMYDPNTGTVRIGGHDIRDLTLASLRENVGVVTQESHLFHDTLRANLSYARPGADEQELIEACRAALMWDTIAALPEGLDTVVGDRGYRLSGGEKQRIALARLLLKAPPIVVLDEATAHLDSESEAAIQQALKTALAGRTSLVIAHRLSTIREADQILVVENGRIRESGTHEELLAAAGLYADLYHTQFSHQATVRKPAGPGPAPSAVIAGGARPGS
nr:ABC transporter transmembrane domain-containing protein [Streptomyces sp. SID10815]